MSSAPWKRIFPAGLNATLLEKENELSKINKDLETLEPYKVLYFLSFCLLQKIFHLSVGTLDKHRVSNSNYIPNCKDYIFLQWTWSSNYLADTNSAFTYSNIWLLNDQIWSLLQAWYSHIARLSHRSWVTQDYMLSGGQNLQQTSF